MFGEKSGSEHFSRPDGRRGPFERALCTHRAERQSEVNVCVLVAVCVRVRARVCVCVGAATERRRTWKRSRGCTVQSSIK